MKRWLDDEEEQRASARARRVVVQALAHCVLQIWQKQRLLGLRDHLRRRTSSPLGLRDMAALLGWEQTRAYEAARDLGDIDGHVAGASASSRMWPRLRAVDELLALDLLEIELSASKAPVPPPFGPFFAATVEHFATVSAAAMTRKVREALRKLDGGDLEMAALGAWLTDRRKDPAVRELGSERMQQVLSAALGTMRDVAEREYASILQKCARRRARR